MTRATPFFQGFSSILFGSPRLSGLDSCLRKLRNLNSLSDFFDTFQFLIPHTLLHRSNKGVNSRQRLFSTHVTFWAFLIQTMAPATSCRDVLRKVQAWWASRSSAQILHSTSTCAYTKARKRLAIEVISPIATHITAHLEKRVTKTQLWCGRKVRVVDGTTASMPDTPENQERYPQSKSQSPGCGFPLMRIVAIFSLASGALLHYAKSNKHVHESILFTSMIRLLEKGDVLLADRGFCSFTSFWRMKCAGIDAVMRLNGVRKVDFLKGKKLGANDFLLTWKKPTQRPKECSQEEFAALPKEMMLRHTTITVSARGHRTQSMVIVTTLLDPIAYSVESLGKLYFERWSVELRFREIKITLGMDILRCKTPDMVEKEVLMHTISYNLVRAIMQQAASENQVDLGRISFKGTVDTMRSWSAQIEAARGKPNKQKELIATMNAIIAKDQLPLRPDREEPRVKKRRPKNYQLMTAPRHEMKYHGHRNRPSKSLS